MSEENIKSYTAAELQAMRDRGESLTDWARVDAKTEGELEADIASDPDWAGIAKDWMLSQNAVLVRGLDQRAIVVDRAVAEWFGQEGGNFEARINEVLRTYIREHSEA